MTERVDDPSATNEFASLPPAGLLRRLGALVYDSLIVIAIWMTTGYAAVALKALVLGPLGIPLFGPVAADTATGPLVQTLVVLAAFCYYAYFWTRNQQTISMQAWRLRVQQPDGRPITVLQAAIRCVVALPGLMLLGAGYLWVLVDPSRRSWTDLASGTRTVVYHPRRDAD